MLGPDIIPRFHNKLSILTVGASCPPLANLGSANYYNLKLTDWFIDLPADSQQTYKKIRKATLAYFNAKTEERFINEPLHIFCSAGKLAYVLIVKTATESHIPSNFTRYHLTDLLDIAKSSPKKDELQAISPSDSNMSKNTKTSG